MCVEGHNTINRGCPAVDYKRLPLVRVIVGQGEDHSLLNLRIMSGGDRELHLDFVNAISLLCHFTSDAFRQSADPVAVKAHSVRRKKYRNQSITPFWSSGSPDPEPPELCKSSL